jgi:hypothetical protein
VITAISLNDLIKKFSRGFVMTMACVALLGTGCDSGGGGGGDGGGGGGEVVGTWLITKEGIPAYWFFNEDGTFRKNRGGEPIGGALHFTGTYTANGSSFSGSFTNPGVGNGEIQGTVSGNSLTMDFIEFWHTPTKVVPCVGDRQ